MNKRPLILITNDDGITARGIHCLAEAVKDLGDIIVVAPDGPRSGQSSAITVDSLLRLTPREFGEGIEAYSVNGTPADCVKLAMHALMRERRPDIILAGINHGSNSGNSVNYSGTMGAVIEGCFAGVPSVVYSLLDHSHNADFSFILPMVTEITRKVLSTGLPKDICLNINFPKGIVPKGLKMAAGARGRWTEEYEEYVSPHGKPFYLLTGKYIEENPDDDTTDNYWLSRGWATIVPVRPDQTAFDQIKPLEYLTL